jgi:hypothetical protein
VRVKAYVVLGGDLAQANDLYDYDDLSMENWRLPWS